MSDYLLDLEKTNLFPFYRFNLPTNYHFFWSKTESTPFFGFFEAIDTSFFLFEGLAALYLESEYATIHYEKTASSLGGQMLTDGVTPKGSNSWSWHLV